MGGGFFPTPSRSSLGDTMAPWRVEFFFLVNNGPIRRFAEGRPQKSARLYSWKKKQTKQTLLAPFHRTTRNSSDNGNNHNHNNISNNNSEYFSLAPAAAAIDGKSRHLQFQTWLEPDHHQIKEYQPSSTFDHSWPLKSVQWVPIPDIKK